MLSPSDITPTVDFLAVRCPLVTCSGTPGEPCTTPGMRTTTTHLARVGAARRAEVKRITTQWLADRTCPHGFTLDPLAPKCDQGCDECPCCGRYLPPGALH
jgi:hypothetical protein